MKLLPLILFAPAIAHAWQFEAGAGVTNYQTVDGRWYQQGATHSLDHVSSAWSIGVTGDVTPWLAWHAGYVDLGRATASCTCVGDAFYDTGTHKIKSGYPDYGTFSGHGATQGFALTLEPHTSTHGWRLGVEVGAYIGRTHWQEDVQVYDTGGHGGPVYNVMMRKWQVSPVAGLSVGTGPWSIRYRHYFTSVGADRTYPPVFRDADVIEYVLKF